MAQQLEEKSKKLLTRAKERISLLYIEKARIEQSEYGVQIRQGNKISEIPITTISCIILGPGTTITHRAVSNIAQAGCSICWMGMNQAVFYAYGEPATNKSKNILKQMHYHESKVLHTEIIHKMYNWRYPNDKIKSMTLNKLKGHEGIRVKECYERCAKLYNIDWDGRIYDKFDFEKSDTVNKYISALNNILYAITEAIILIMGYSPAIGFIHTGRINSFVFDISDLFKERLTIPLAFKLTKEYGFFNRDLMIKEFRKEITEQKTIKQMVKYLEELFSDDVSLIDAELKIWDSFDYINDI